MGERVEEEKEGAGWDEGEEQEEEEEEDVEAARGSRVSSSGASSLAGSRRSEAWAAGSDAGSERNGGRVGGRGVFFAQGGPPSARRGKSAFSPRATPVRGRPQAKAVTNRGVYFGGG